MANTSKAQFLNDVQTLLKKRYKPKGDKEKESPRLTILEAVVYAIAREGSTRLPAAEALGRFKSGYFDWNEVRVSTIDEVTKTLAPLPDPEPRAQKVRRFLRQLFEKTYGFNLEALTKKPLKESLKVLIEYEALESDFVQATVIQQSLGGHAIPVDEDCRRVLQRLGVIDSETDINSIRSLLERAVPKNRGVEFRDLLEDLANDTCVPGPPDCPRCELKKVCPTALTKKDPTAIPKAVAASAAVADAPAKTRAGKSAAAPKAKSGKGTSSPSAPAPAPATVHAKGEKGEHQAPSKPERHTAVEAEPATATAVPEVAAETPPSKKSSTKPKAVKKKAE